MIRLLLDRKVVEIDRVDCDLTVLDWLRLHQRRTGSKEGCNSGDCGACTVVVASPIVHGPERLPRLKYETINSCITFVGALHGKQLLTVESLGDNGQLHPVQKAMVENHASQCGFCTPGFVMSLYALYQSDEPLDEIGLRIDQALGGNLCRCTGYRAIKSAALQAMNRREASQLESVSSRPNSEHTVHQGVNTTQRTEKSQMATTARELGRLAAKKPDVQGFYQPRTVSELARIYLENPKMRLLGGGTDLALEVTEQCRKFDGIIHLGRVRELNLAKVNGESLELGAAVTLTRCLDILKHRIPGAENMLLRFGSDQIRNQATVGGNFGSASPIADLPPLLLALNCVLDLQKGDDIRQVPLDNFYTGYRKTELQPGEFIRTVRVSLPAPDSMFAVHKVSKRRLDDISTVCMAINLPQSDGKSQGVRLAFGGMAATPIRATRAEAALEDRVFDNQSVRDAKRALIEELHPISDMRASAGYRLQIAQNLLQRVLMEVTLS